MNNVAAAKRRGKKRFVTGLWVGLACAFCMVTAYAGAYQESATPDPPKALVSATTAYVILPTRFICADGLNVISVSPDRKDVLLRHTVIEPAHTLEVFLRDLDEHETETLRRGERLSQQLLLVRPDSPQVQTVWQGGGSLASGLKRYGAVRWLPGTRTALITLSGIPGPLPPQFLDEEPTSKEIGALQASETTTVLSINTETGKSQAIASGLSSYTWLLTSRTHPVAVLVNLEDSSFVRVEANGKLGPRLYPGKPEGKKEAPLLSGFLADGRTLTGRIFEREPDGKQMHTTYYQVDSLTGQMTEVKAVDNKPNIPTRPVPPFIVQRETATLVRDGANIKVHPLWLEGQDKSLTGRVLIAADSDADSTPTLLESGVLYQHKGALYLVPILKADAADFQARQHQAAKAKPEPDGK